jgi:organic hydroperoxide reductase OsmC/OhrA
MSAVIHRYEARLRWTGSTGAGWERYDRAHEAAAPPAAQSLTLTTGESKGDPRQLNPEQLLVMAASSCQLLWFLHLAAKARIDVVEYTDEPTAEMPEGEGLSGIVLRPRIVLGSEANEERIEKLVQTAHEQCNVAASLRTPIAIEPRVVTPA